MSLTVAVVIGSTVIRLIVVWPRRLLIEDLRSIGLAIIIALVIIYQRRIPTVAGVGRTRPVDAGALIKRITPGKTKTQ
jgi:hypothetical protein